MISIFLDTNILLDHLEQRPAFADAATKLWQSIEQGQVKAFISAISFNNVFYVLKKKCGRAVAMQAVAELRMIFSTVALNELIIDGALQSPLLDFEDAIQAESAVAAGAAFLVTRDRNHFAEIPVPLLDPAAIEALIRSS